MYHHLAGLAWHGSGLDQPLLHSAPWVDDPLYHLPHLPPLLLWLLLSLRLNLGHSHGLGLLWRLRLGLSRGLDLYLRLDLNLRLDLYLGLCLYLRLGLNLRLLGLSSIVKVINSQKLKVNIEKLRKLATEVNIKIVQTFPWAVVSPSVHRILAHSWEVISLNEGSGLGGESEEGLEALNKYIHQIREHGARKDSTKNNFSDTFHHLWDRSRPVIVEMERKIKKKKSKVLIMSEIEVMVESLFIEDE